MARLASKTRMMASVASVIITRPGTARCRRAAGVERIGRAEAADAGHRGAALLQGREVAVARAAECPAGVLRAPAIRIGLRGVEQRAAEQNDQGGKGKAHDTLHRGNARRAGRGYAPDE